MPWVWLDDLDTKMRDVDVILCDCGGKLEKTECTEAEEKDHGCGLRRCCAAAFVCDKCGIRKAFTLPAPNCEWGDE